MSLYIQLEIVSPTASTRPSRDSNVTGRPVVSSSFHRSFTPILPRPHQQTQEAVSEHRQYSSDCKVGIIWKCKLIYVPLEMVAHVQPVIPGFLMSSLGMRLQLATRFLLSFGHMFTVTKCMFAHVTVVVSLLYLFHLLSLVLLAPLCDIRLFLCTRGLLPVGPAPCGASCILCCFTLHGEYQHWYPSCGPANWPLCMCHQNPVCG